MFKVCKECEEEKPLEDFPKNKEMRDGHINLCKKCKYSKYYKSRNSSDEYWSGQLKWKYGIDIEEYNNLLHSQKGLCAICGGNNKGKRLCVDHRHDTGKIRGLLCTTCNKAVGQLGDTPESLRKALEYLEKTH